MILKKVIFNVIRLHKLKSKFNDKIILLRIQNFKHPDSGNFIVTLMTEEHQHGTCY